MKYMKQFKTAESKAVEITKAQAAETLEGYWDATALKDLFDNDRAFRLYTPFSEVWTVDDKGRVMMPGFYGFS